MAIPRKKQSNETRKPLSNSKVAKSNRLIDETISRRHSQFTLSSNTVISLFKAKALMLKSKKE
ncbi:hypothetical protein D3C78_1858150 [compost metagenome]